MATRTISAHGVLATAALLAVSGCGPAASLRLVQPQLAGWQREVRIESDQVRWAGAEGTERVLAEFPLPGARTGRATYLLYLRVAAGAKTATFDAAAGTPQARGFLIQTRGEYAGLTRLTAGRVDVRGTSQAAGAKRRIQLDAACEDGSRVSGTLDAARDDYAVTRFETRQRPADVQALVNAATATRAN